ncbi:unnamed protein product [Gongylonema pulchrum]|uniref:N-end rule aminoacyl transferase C-terminal domain-containing protein n=1 Tax=Gongylonema pulchrum TaxID=637853 RepID=A0A3P6P3Y1_9BILA|nr:unnamed protein product [Gongylonema pulchrum]
MVPVESDEYDATADESFELYKNYQNSIHKDTQCTRRGFTDFLTDSPLFSDEEGAENKSVALGTYHQQYYLDGQLIAVGVVDILPRCLSSKYLFHDPQYKFLMLGTYTALREIAFVRELMKERPELHYYYMGYYIHSCAKMRYKGRFHPSDLLCDRSFTWVPLEKCIEMMGSNGERLEAFAPDAPEPEKCPTAAVRCLYNRYLYFSNFLDL